jgi:hypothetical protein
MIFVINIIFFALSIIHRAKYGDGTLDRVKLKGPFAESIAFKEFHCKKT